MISRRLPELETGQLPSKLEALHKPEKYFFKKSIQKLTKETRAYSKICRKTQEHLTKRKKKRRFRNRLGKEIIQIVEVQDIKHVLRKDKETAEKFDRLLASVLTAGEV